MLETTIEPQPQQVLIERHGNSEGQHTNANIANHWYGVKND